ncbi:hypothetical protein JD844_033998 [Phrynosoma platyrhinos]|uniref:Armadillo repeat-containing protein 6 n=1 Tax=Phrynosoma platyrhinos TaxID=52577 RepID=A0ABQ7T7R2_PHRPL|nr:hypothetical protein JD844_033998 [Phrynosoma platyrhinos]
MRSENATPAFPRLAYFARRMRRKETFLTSTFPSDCRYETRQNQVKMAAKRITQETFDEVVLENMVEFGMDPEEAVTEATLDCLQKAVIDADLGKVDELLVSFAKQCRQELAVRYLAGQKGAYPAVLAACRLAFEDRSSLLKALHALSVLLDGQPDLFDASGQELVLRVLQESHNDADLTLAGVRCIRHACLKHEQNRQDLVKSGILSLLTGAIVQHGDRADVVREACSGLRIMTFDDDIRVPFGHAHDHAKMIVVEHNGLGILIEAAKVCATLARLSVRNEFCQDIVDLGGLNFIDLVKQVLSAIRAIAGNDDVKDAIVNAGGTDLIVLAMSRHLGSPQSCAALCMLALRKPENCRVIMEGGGALAALQAMKTHPREVSVQKQACMLIRNLVAHTQDFSQPILEMGAENLITEARAAHRDCDDVAKAALRDLGCKVELRELWTGQKGGLAH